MIDEIWNIVNILLLVVLSSCIIVDKRRRSAPVFALATLFFACIFLRPEIYQLVALRRPDQIDGVYIQQAYRTTDNELRFVYYKNSQLRNQLKFWDGVRWRNIAERPLKPLMRAFMRCHMEPHLGVVRFENASDSSELWLMTEIAKEKQQIRVQDVRQPARFSAHYKYPHTIGVCLQPIYFHADWTVFIQYFEFWLASGATKFYVYLHSSTRQVRAVLDYYKMHLGDNLEIIDWSDLPVDDNIRGDFHADPNTRIYRVGIHGAINDCTMRARYQVKFLSMLDLDETIQVASGRPLLDELQALAESYPRMATMSLQWLYASHTNNNNNIARRPADISFESFRTIRRPLENQVFAVYNDFRKLILRPERIILTDIHNTLVNELIDGEYYLDNVPAPGSVSLSSAASSGIAQFNGEGADLRHSQLRYDEQEVTADRLAVVHLRRFNPNIQGTRPIKFSNDSKEFYSFAEIGHKMSSGFKEKLVVVRSRGNFSDYDMGSGWQATVDLTMRTLEECRYYPFNYQQTLGKGTCQSVANCEPRISDLRQFSKVDQNWRNINKRGKFVNYIRRK